MIDTNYCYSFTKRGHIQLLYSSEFPVEPQSLKRIQLPTKDTALKMESGSNKNSSLLILHNALIVTMDTENRVFQSGAIVIEDDTIKAIGQSTGIISQFSSFSPQLIDFEGHFILPGTPLAFIHIAIRKF